MNSRKKKIITFGTFDLLHIGHLNILKRAKELGDYLLVGVSSDKLNYSKKHVFPIYSQEDRLEIVRSIVHVDEVFLEESLELKADYIKYYNADILVMGKDWEGKFDQYKKLCKVIYLERTPFISTTEAKLQIIQKEIDKKDRK